MPSEAAEETAKKEAKLTGKPARADMTSRFVGLIVVPGKQIVKMELEESRVMAPTTAHASASTPALTIRTRN